MKARKFQFGPELGESGTHFSLWAPGAHSVVLEIEGRGGVLVLGLVADHVFEVTGLDTEQVEPPPEIGVRWRSDYIVGVGRRRDAFVVVLDVARLFAASELAGIGEAGPAAAA